MTMKNKWFIILPILLLSSPAVRAQQLDLEESLNRAIQLWQNDQDDQAAALLRKLLDQYPGRVEVVQVLAQVEMDRERWGEAKGLWKTIRARDKKNLLASYGLGMSYRETGKHKALLLRAIDWKKSRQYFEMVVARDPGFRDVFSQYAILQRYRGQYSSAVDLGEKQLIYHPYSLPSVMELHRSYDQLLFHSPENLEGWLRRRPGERARLFLGELLRRKGYYAPADSIFLTLLNEPSQGGIGTAARLSLVRSCIQQRHDAEAARYFQTALDSLSGPIDEQMLFEDMAYAFSDQDLATRAKLKTLEDKRQFYRLFWLLRDPLPAADTNVRLIEHFRRLLYAEENYRYDSFRLEFNNPDKMHYLQFPKVFSLNKKFNDKGLVYIRHGSPHERVFSIGQSIRQNETWVYYADDTHKKMMFHFFIDDNATGNNWRLGAEITRDMLDSRLTIDPVFQQMYMAEPLEKLRYDSIIAERSREDVAAGLNSDRHSWEEKVQAIDFPYSMAAFRDEEGSPRYDVILGLTTNQLWPSSKSFNPDDEVMMGVVVFDHQWNPQVRRNWSLRASRVRALSDSLGYYVVSIPVASRAPQLYVSLFVNIPSEKKVGGYRFNYTGRTFPYGRLAMSDILLSHHVKREEGGGEFARHGLTVRPNPGGIFDRRLPLYVYFELYNLPVKGQEPLAFTLKYRLKLLKKYQGNVFNRLAKLFSKESEEISNLVERRATGEMSVEYLALDLGKKSYGRYQLQVVAQCAGSDPISSQVEFDLR
jgi:hypothetical protein